jgi:hypothetical protein
MKKMRFLKWFFRIVIFLMAIILLIVLYVTQFRPNVPLKELSVEMTPERIERGKYLANHVMVCMDCHSTRDWSLFSAPILPGTEGKGGELFDRTMGFPGEFVSPNITPFNLKNWTDGEIYRAITSGVGKDDNPLFPVMPYMNYGMMDDEDIFSVIAYLRTLPEQASETPRHRADFPVNLLLHLMPAAGKPTPIPAKDDQVNYGKYLVTAAVCIDCHTPFEKGQLVMAHAFAGGREFAMPNGLLVSPNITPDENTGIGSWTKEMFIEKFKTFDPALHETETVTEGAFNTIMPWTMYAGMDTTDLGAIYAYLRTLEPLENLVVRFVPKEKLLTEK